mgnify:FL=1
MPAPALPIRVASTCDLGGRRATLVISVGDVVVIDIAVAEANGGQAVIAPRAQPISTTLAMLARVNLEYRAWADYVEQRLTLPDGRFGGAFNGETKKIADGDRQGVEIDFSCNGFATSFEYHAATGKIETPGRAGATIPWPAFKQVAQIVDDFLLQVASF